jgi:hypothetical protein
MTYLLTCIIPPLPPPVIRSILVFVSFLCPFLTPHSRFSDPVKNREEYVKSARKLTGVKVGDFSESRSVLFVYHGPIDGREQPETYAQAMSVFALVDGSKVQFKRGRRAILGENTE